jgi:hypothetical protein
MVALKQNFLIKTAGDFDQDTALDNLDLIVWDSSSGKFKANLSSSSLILKTGTVAFTGNQSLGGFLITNLGTPSSSTDASTKGYVDTTIAALAHNSLTGLTTGDPHTQYLKTDGTRALTGNMSIGSNRLTNLADPSSAQDAATKAYVDSNAVAYAPLKWKQSAYCSTTANVDLA